MSRYRLVALRFSLSCAALSAVLASCVAQEPYHPLQAGAGSAGKSSGPSLAGSLTTDPQGDGAAGAGGEGGEADDPTGTGPACVSSDQCALPYPYCQPSLGRCVECASQRNCSGTDRPYCDLRSYSCVKCLSDTQCTKIAPYCALALGECVECLSTDNCGTGELACDRINFRCVSTCQTNADCKSSVQTPFCDPDRSLCVSCVNDGDCPNAEPRCRPLAKTCVTCLEDVDCAAPTARCDTHTNVCRQCLTNRDCSPGVNCVAGVCVNPH